MKNDKSKQIRSIERVDAAALEKAYREGYANGYVNGLDDAHRWETGGGSNRHKERDTEDAWLASDAKASTDAPAAVENCAPLTGSAFSLHHGKQCVLCSGCEEDSDFDYCRACGYTVFPISSPPSNKEETRAGLPAFAKAIEHARGGPPPPPLQHGFA